MKMNKSIFKLNILPSGVALLVAASVLQSCVPTRTVRNEKVDLPGSYTAAQANDTANTAQIKWKPFFDDANLATLIDSALVHNQELNILH